MSRIHNGWEDKFCLIRIEYKDPTQNLKFKKNLKLASEVSKSRKYNLRWLPAQNLLRTVIYFIN